MGHLHHASQQGTKYPIPLMGIENTTFLYRCQGFNPFLALSQIAWVGIVDEITPYRDIYVASLPTQKAACITKRIQPSDMNVAVHHGPTAPVAILKINPHGLKESPFFFTQMPAYRTMTSRVRIKKSLPDAPHPTGLEMHGCSILRIYPLPLLYSQFYPAPRSSPGPVLCLAAR